MDTLNYRFFNSASISWPGCHPPEDASGEAGSEGCGTVQNWRRPIILIEDAKGHAFGDDPSEADGAWVKEGEAEPNHGNKHFALAGGYHNHDDHPNPCGGGN